MQAGRGTRFAVLGLIALALLLRVGVVVVRQDELDVDRDAYLAIARQIADGNGISGPGGSRTAFRPPLYPVLLSLSPGAGWVAGLNVVAGTLTVIATVWLGRNLGLAPTGQVLAGFAVAVDPLLLRYTSQPMTESLCALLVCVLLAVLVRGRSGPTTVRSLLAGVAFGMAALCRPTVWAFAVLAVAWGCLSRVLSRWTSATGVMRRGFGRRGVLAMSLGVLLTVGPWGIRNFLVFGRPIVTTTHGGYTLLLGNNPRFDREVVQQPWGTVWDGSMGGGQEGWVADLQRQMHREGVEGELAEDRWQAARAWSWIRENPGRFVDACLLRMLRFWNVVPLAEGGSLPRGVTVSVGAWFAMLYVLAVCGVLRCVRGRERDWIWPVLMVVAFAGVHLVYWSNARMRAPVEPVVCLLAARGVSSRVESGAVR